ncbi:3-deoxy-7-phosphoheptulonate synthase [SAR86 cluster bacterium]|nr:3-deoxy-7-phosphoheptulonate synthase [SAR86 cluster bacterium]
MYNKFPGKDITEEDIKSKIPLVANFSKEPFEIAGVVFNGKKIPVMAGPNMVESEELIIETAKSVKASGASFLRGGAFKPLSFPYRNEKYTETGLDGLKWLKSAREEVEIPVITEVMEEKHLDAVCDATDILQIGSRNMQNYPLIVESAKTGFPIMLKRHYGASLRDWLGAAEYALKEGCTKLILCERGMSIPHTHRATSRFSLDLQVVPATQEITNIPVATDPSHATFWRDWVEPMTLASIASGADSIMLEVHPDPENSAVDPLQPINFETFNSLMKKMDNVAKAVSKEVI